MRLLSIWQMKKSTKAPFINSSVKDGHVNLPKTKDILERMDDDDISATSIHDRYAARPNNLENMCLATFAANYEPYPSK